MQAESVRGVYIYVSIYDIYIGFNAGHSLDLTGALGPPAPTSPF